MGKIISFANQKGGVGKTTSAINVAACLGNMGKKTLLIDLDPQGNSTSGVGITKKGLKQTIYEVLTEGVDIKEAILATKFDNLSVIPSTIALAGAELELIEMDNSEYRMRDALNTIRNDYDYIIVDCPPSLGMLTVNALSASDGVVIPMQCEFYALEGLSQLMNTVSRIRSHYNEALQVTGILITMYNARLLLSLQVINEMEKHYSDKLFSTMITRGVRLSEAPGFGKPICYHDPKGKGTQEYMAVAKELTDRI